MAVYDLGMIKLLENVEKNYKYKIRFCFKAVLR